MLVCYMYIRHSEPAGRRGAMLCTEPRRVGLIDRGLLTVCGLIGNQIPQLHSLALFAVCFKEGVVKSGI
jgi:hypothetical protein